MLRQLQRASRLSVRSALRRWRLLGADVACARLQVLSGVSASQRQANDLELAKRILESEEDLDASCSKDALIAQQLDAQLKREAVRVAKLEKRERELVRRKLCKCSREQVRKATDDEWAGAELIKVLSRELYRQSNAAHFHCIQ